MPKIQIVTDQKTIEKYGGTRMYFAPPADYDRVMKAVPVGKLLTVGGIREYFARKNGADFTDPITAGIFVSIAAWASCQREGDETPYWRTLKAGGERTPNIPGAWKRRKSCWKPKDIGWRCGEEQTCAIMWKITKQLFSAELTAGRAQICSGKFWKFVIKAGAAAFSGKAPCLRGRVKE